MTTHRDEDGHTFECAVTIDSTSGSFARQKTLNIPAAAGRAGGTATVGYVNTGTDATAVTLAASATADTWVIPLTGLLVGDVITSFRITGQIESAGGAVTVDANLRKMVGAVADPTDASVDSITQISVTADTEIDDAKSGLSATVASGEVYYILVTSTTAASTDIQLLGAEVTVTGV